VDFFIETTQKKKLREGYVELKRMKGKDWKSLYCVLYKDFIYFFEPHERVSINIRPYTLINLKFITSVDYGKSPLTFNITTPLRRFVIRSKHEVAVDEWIQKIDERRLLKQGQKGVTPHKVQGNKKLLDNKGYMYTKPIRGKMRLIDTTNGNKRKVYKFPKSAPNGGNIGRSSSNDLSLSCDGYISRSHCRIEIKENVPFLFDLGSHTGTLLNGKKVTSSPLKPGDIVRIGRTDFEFQVKEGDLIFAKTRYDESSSEEKEKEKEKDDDVDLIENSDDEEKNPKKPKKSRKNNDDGSS